MISLIVDIRIKEEDRSDFLDAITEGATKSVAQETGCTRFDICEDLSDPGHFVFYEIYADDIAIEDHKATKHYAEWRGGGAKYVQEQTVLKARLVASP